ncbi:MAG: signal peptidase I [Prolixibacteraceae bacterium]|nr:signal peptidase I [Prolixibacteraceae bacterium]MBN2648544.1 signal peptidase I [Prolixibacteraceae bacterium]
MKNIKINKWIKFAFWGLLYLLWVIWLGNYWFLIGLPIIFDIYITKKVHWAFWKKKNPPNGKQTKMVEWIDAVIFAVIAASFIRLFFFEAYVIPTSSMEKSMMVGDYLFVSKVAYGPKLPNTPLSFPFVHQSMPMTNHKVKSYLEWIQKPYRRLKGFNEVENNDIVVFNFPEGDTVAINFPSQNYHDLVRMYGRDEVLNNKRRFGRIYSRPVDKKENYIKRCVAIAGDSLRIIDGQVYVNGNEQKHFPGVQYDYIVTTDGSLLNQRVLDRLEIARADREMFSGGRYLLPLTSQQVEQFKALKNVVSVKKFVMPKGNYDQNIFPHTPEYQWNVDNFGPLYIPKKDATIDLTIHNLPLYERVIRNYEENSLEVKDSTIFINGEPASKYTFKMNYYWMMGDNRHKSADSRYWGFVPEDHVVGRASIIWMSLDKDDNFPKNIRFKRLFKTVHQ